MSVIQSFICEKFREVVAEFSSPSELFRSSCTVVSPDASYVALGVEETLYILGTAIPDQRSKIVSNRHELSRPIGSVFPAHIAKDSETMDVVFVGTTDGHVVCVHVDGITLLEMHFGSEPVRSVQIHTEAESQQLAVLCGSIITCVQWEDLVRVLFKGLSMLRNTYPTRPNLDFTTAELHVRYEMYDLPVENRQFQFMCSDPISLGLFNYSVRKAIKSPDDPDSENVLAMPVQTLWTVTGEKPFVTFNISGKVVSSLTSLLYAEARRMFWGSKSTKKNVATVQFIVDASDSLIPSVALQSGKSTSLELFRALADQRRQVRAMGMVSSNDRQWIALTDNLGRVLLIDAQRERVARIWKGYRDAEVAFFDVVESPSSHRHHHTNSTSTFRYATAHTRHTRCLFIHAPHIRILEVWRLVHGPRLAAWDVDEPVRLIPAQSQMIGAFDRQSSVQEGTDQLQAFLLDSKGTLYTLSVSPELCLAETDAEAVLGYHEFQVMQTCHTYLDQLHSLGPAAVIEQLLKQFAQFKTASWFEQALLRTIHHLHQTPHLLTDMVHTCITLLDERGKDQNDDTVPAEFQRLQAQLSKMHSLMQFYQSIVSVNNAYLDEKTQADKMDTSQTWLTDAESIADLLNWDVEDTVRCLNVYALCARILRPGSHLRLAKPIGIHAFLDCFKYVIDSGVRKRGYDSDSAESLDSDRNRPTLVHVALQPQDSLMRLSKLGSMIFGPYLLGKQPYDALLKQLSENVLTPDILLYTLTSYILRWECFHHLPNLIRRMHRLYAHLLTQFCESDSEIHRLDTSGWPDSFSVTSDLAAAPVQCTGLSQPRSRFEHLWYELFQFVVASAQISSAYLLSLVFRSLLYHAWQSADQGRDLLRSWRACAKFESPPEDTTTGEFLGSSSDFKQSAESAHAEDSPIPFDTTGESERMQPATTATLHNLVNQWHDACTRFEDLFCLGLLVQLPATDSHQVNDDRSRLTTYGFPITMRRVLTCGRACLTEVFASWLVRWRMRSDQLITFYQGMCSLTQSASGDDTTDLALNNAADLRRALLSIVYKRLPFTLELDVVIASVCWMHYQRWLSEPKVLTHLHQCIEFLRRLSSAGATIAQGMGRLIWQGDLRLWYGKCLNATRTTQQTRSRQPVDKHLKELSILIMRFFSVYSHACQKAEVVPIFSIEQHWIGLENPRPPWKHDVSRDLRSQSEEPAGNLVDPTPPAVLRMNTAMNLSHTLAAEVAVNQPHPPPQSVASWEQAVIVVAAMCTFSCPHKSSRRASKDEAPQFYQVSDFFPAQDAQFINERFNPDWVSKSVSMEPDGSLDNRRRLFISWLIDRAVQSYRNSLEPSNPQASQHSDRRSVSPSSCSSIGELSSSRPVHDTPGRYSTSVLDVYTLFTTAAGTLARHWGYPRDMALSQHVLALFEADLDDQAELYLSQIEDTATLATRLLLVVGRRVAWQCFGSRNPEAASYQLRWRACIPFDLESWLRGLLLDIPSDSPVLESPSARFDPSTELQQLVRLIDFVLSQIPPQASQAHIAEALRDTIYTMHEAD